MPNELRAYLFPAWWTSALHGLAIFLTALAVNLFGDGVGDALDPQPRTGASEISLLGTKGRRRRGSPAGARAAIAEQYASPVICRRVTTSKPSVAGGRTTGPDHEEPSLY